MDVDNDMLGLQLFNVSDVALLRLAAGKAALRCVSLCVCESVSVCVFVCESLCVVCVCVCVCVGLARTIYKRCIYGIFGRKITEYTVTYGVYYIRLWPTLCMCLNECFGV